MDFISNSLFTPAELQRALDFSIVRLKPGRDNWANRHSVLPDWAGGGREHRAA
jgi:hypothetical protein